MISYEKINNKLTKNENVKLNKDLLFNKKKINRNKWLYEQHIEAKKELLRLQDLSYNFRLSLEHINKENYSEKELKKIEYYKLKLKMFENSISEIAEKNTISIPKILKLFIRLNILVSIIFAIIFSCSGIYILGTNSIEGLERLIPDIVSENFSNKAIGLFFFVRSLINIFTIKLSFYIEKSLAFEYIKDKEKRKYKELFKLANNYKNDINEIKNKINNILNK